MADTDDSQKTEKPSQQKLKKTREQGQVARSRDLSTAIGIVIGLKLFILLVPGYLDDFRHLFGQSFLVVQDEGSIENALSTAVSDAILLLVKLVLPLLAIPLCVIAGSLVPGGWVINGTHLLPKLERLSPSANLGRLFSYKHGIGLLTSIGKATVLVMVLIHVTRSGAADYMRLQSQPLDQALIGGAGMMVDGLMALCMVFVLFAVIDVPAQVFIFLRNLRMSKQEMKEEYKSTEGRPEIRQRIRQLQHQLARRSVRKTVPTADVVIVNPEHYAVALKYEEARAEAPFVIAKGIDEMALYIKQIANEHGIEVLAQAPLARAIYNTSQVQQQIPAALYRAVAQVLNYVLQLKAFRAGRRPALPMFPSEIVVPSHLTEELHP